jgi:1,4-alpha-glucan branching enzyme
MIDDLWYKNAIIYSLNVGTFMDSNGDGVGDFEGLSRRLDYLSGLGVTCLWLQPFQPSPNRDAGYDVTDFYGVDPRHGSSGDFVDFAHQAAQRGIRIILDLVVNHTSDQHPGSNQRGRIRVQSTATGMYGRRRSRRITTGVWYSRVCNGLHGAMTKPPGSGTTTVFTNFSRT